MLHLLPLFKVVLDYKYFSVFFIIISFRAFFWLIIYRSIWRYMIWALSRTDSLRNFYKCLFNWEKIFLFLRASRKFTNAFNWLLSLFNWSFWSSIWYHRITLFLLSKCLTFQKKIRLSLDNKWARQWLYIFLDIIIEIIYWVTIFISLKSLYTTLLG